jgi:hypothetical protein
MNQEANNDIDILLRKLSRQDGNPLKAQDGDHVEQDHLDADELNAYAENALPIALRARYTEHLADCTNCRKTVTQLSLASAVVVPARVEEAKPSALKTFFAALFSPFVIRYAVPAMAIVVVVAIAWVALQRRSPSNYIAQNVASESPAPAAVQNEVERSSSPSVEQFKGQVGERKESPARAGEKTAANQEPSEIKQKEAIAEENKARVATTDDFRDRQELAKRNQPQPVASAPAAGGVAGTTTVAASRKPDAVSERRDEVAQKKESEADKAKVMSEPPARAADSISGPAKSPEVKSAPKSAPSDTAAAGRGLRSQSRAKDDGDSGEVRTVGGHRFRKEGQVWVDSLYSSQRIISVSRGSEQYRALVADEPGIRSIAEQLGTEFIVVWNGRAYRIR